MKKLILIICFIHIQVLFKPPFVDFMNEKNPLNRVAGFKGKTITIFGYIKMINFGNTLKLITVGTLGSRSYHTNGSTDIIVYISCKDGINLKKMEKDELLHSFAFITGTVIRYNGRMALQLRNRKDLDFTSTRSSIILK